MLNDTLRLLILGTLTLTLFSKPLNIPHPLSKKAQLIYNSVTNANTVATSDYPTDTIANYAKFIDDEVGYGSTALHCQRIYYPSILSAREEVVITTFLFDNESPCAAVAAKALRDLNNKLNRRGGGKVRVYLILSTLSKFSFWKNPKSKYPGISDFTNYLAEADPLAFGLPAADELPNLDFRVKSYHVWPLGAVHNKLIVVDGQELAIGSKNWDQEGGYEYTSRWQGSVAQSARKDFQRIWEEPLPALTSVSKVQGGGFPVLYLSRISNAWPTHPEDNPQDQAWIRAIELAEREVYIQSPNFTTQMMVNKVLEAVRRGVKVRIVTAFSYNDISSYLNTQAIGNNRYTIKQMYDDLDGEAQEVVDNLQICYFIGKRVQPPRPVAEEYSHVKFMAVDGEFYIFGSGNQDTQSWYNSSESNLLVDDAEDTKRMLGRLMRDQQSFENCYRDLNGERDIKDPTWRDEEDKLPTQTTPFNALPPNKTEP